MQQFLQYIEHTYDCHDAEGFGSCRNDMYFIDYKCAEFRAKYYVELIDNPTCLTDMML